ncbi:threonine dehydratase [Pseudonocardia eucalypti]|nr:threonine dehydratase [Pseudonocardia eucalypti]
MSVDTANDLSLARIEQASRLIDPVFRNSPQFRDLTLSRRLGRDLLVKVESVNPVRSFKGRGADFCVSQLPAGRRVVCASAGNFGQAMAYAGRTHGVPVTVFAATDANPNKVARMRTLGAEVVLTGHDFDAAKAAAREHVATRPESLFVEDGEDPRIAEGAGTIGVELAAEAPDALLLPVGNGALVGGVGRWLKAHSPATRIIGVCAEGAPAMAHSWRAGRPVATDRAETMADGIAVRVPVPVAVGWMGRYMDDMLLVGEEDIPPALELVRDTLGLLLEPAGAVGVAAVLRHNPEGKKLATVLTGGNFSPELLRRLAG